MDQAAPRARLIAKGLAVVAEIVARNLRLVYKTAKSILIPSSAMRLTVLTDLVVELSPVKL